MKTLKSLLDEKRFNDDTNETLEDFGFIKKSSSKSSATVSEDIIKAVKLFLKIAVMTVLIMFFIGVYEILSTPKDGGKISHNIVYEKGSDKPAFFGYKFTPRLIKSIENGDIDLYGVNMCSSMNSKLDCYFEDTDEAVPGTASKIIVSNVKYVVYDDEYLDKYYSKEMADEMRGEGYYQYTIDLVD